MRLRAIPHELHDGLGSHSPALGAHSVLLPSASDAAGAPSSPRKGQPQACDWDPGNCNGQQVALSVSALKFALLCIASAALLFYALLALPDTSPSASPACNTWPGSAAQQPGRSTFSSAGELGSVMDAERGRLHLCLGLHNPFAVGYMYLGNLLAHLTVFEAEVVHGSDPGTFLPRNELSTLAGIASVAYLRIMSFIDSSESVWRDYTQSWGGAFSIDPTGVLDKNATQLSLRCQYWKMGGDRPVFETDVLWSTGCHGFEKPTGTEIYVAHLNCLLPPDNTHGILTHPSFQVQVVPADPTQMLLHMQPLYICRGDHHIGNLKARRGINGVVHLDSPYSPSPDTSQTQTPEQEHKAGGGGSHAQRSLAGADAGSQRSSENRSSKGDTALEDIGVIRAPERTTMGLCLRPFFDHPIFAESGKRFPHHSLPRLLEYLDYNLLIGVNHFYFYDRYFDEYKQPLEAYIQMGALLHLPFPHFSEVYYRKESYNDSYDPYIFPDAYDQIIHEEHCAVQSRRYNDKWLAVIDIDEYMQYPMADMGLPVTHVLNSIEADAGRVVSVIDAHRFQFHDSDSLEVVLQNVTRRCMDFMKMKPRGIKRFGWMDKTISDPWRIIGGCPGTHIVWGMPYSEMVWVNENLLKFHHYGGAKYGCKKIIWGPEEDSFEYEDFIVRDTSLVWAHHRIQECRGLQAPPTPPNPFAPHCNIPRPRASLPG